jgi:hypothetical protein
MPTAWPSTAPSARPVDSLLGGGQARLTLDRGRAAFASIPGRGERNGAAAPARRSVPAGNTLGLQDGLPSCHSERLSLRALTLFQGEAILEIRRLQGSRSNTSRSEIASSPFAASRCQAPRNDTADTATHLADHGVPASNTRGRRAEARPRTASPPRCFCSSFPRVHSGNPGLRAQPKHAHLASRTGIKQGCRIRQPGWVSQRDFEVRRFSAPGCVRGGRFPPRKAGAVMAYTLHSRLSSMRVRMRASISSSVSEVVITVGSSAL